MTEQLKKDDFSKRPDMQEITRLRRVRQLAAAIIRRGRDAGIPCKYLRINQKTFTDLLDPSFHGGQKRGVNAVATLVYQDPDFLLKRDFIAIDGGNRQARLLAGYAILFRMIAYDKRGQYWNCDTLLHKLQSINSTESVKRNDLTEELKECEILMIGEFDRLRFSPHFETGNFFDEILSDRITGESPTIITFVNPIISEKMTQENKEKMASEGKLDSGCGRQLAWLGLIPQTTRSVLRIRVKGVEEEEEEEEETEVIEENKEVKQGK